MTKDVKTWTKWSRSSIRSEIFVYERKSPLPKRTWSRLHDPPSSPPPMAGQHFLRGSVSNSEIRWKNWYSKPRDCALKRPPLYSPRWRETIQATANLAVKTGGNGDRFWSPPWSNDKWGGFCRQVCRGFVVRYRLVWFQRVTRDRRWWERNLIFYYTVYIRKIYQK